jgi:hypothetical protein
MLGRDLESFLMPRQHALHRVNGLVMSLYEILSLAVVVLLSLIVVILYLILYYRLPRSASTVVRTRDADLLDEIKKLRDEFEARFGMRFSKEGFTTDEAYPFFLAARNSLNRFDKERGRGSGSNVLTEARGFVAMARLILSWAQANGEEGVKGKAEEFLEAANETLERASHL